MADKLSSGLFISEVLADNAGGSAIDTDGDGQANKADEYVEIQNTTNATLSLDGYEIWSEKEGLLYAFGPGDTIAPGGTATVLGEYTGTPAPGFYDAGGPPNTNFLPDGQGSLWDNIYLVDTNTGEYVVLGYGLPPRAPNPPSGFTGTTQVGAGESINSGAPNGRSIARDADGTLIETEPTPGVPDFVCFVPGTLIDTQLGPRMVEDLRPGDLVDTLDHGPQPLLAIRRLSFSARAVRLDPGLLPVRLNGEGREPLVLSPAHRVLVGGSQADLLFGSAEVLAPAHLLAEGRVPVTGIARYYHLLFARHEVIFANGWAVESLFSREAGNTNGANGPNDWLVADGVDLAGIHHAATARPVLKRHETTLWSGREFVPQGRDAAEFSLHKA